MMSERHVTYGDPERFYDTDRQTVEWVRKRFEKWWVDDQQYGRWDYVPAFPNPAWVNGKAEQ